jgi:type II secretory pathway pseudopilin PulG
MASIVGMLLGSLAPTVIANRGKSMASALDHAVQDSASR